MKKVLAIVLALVMVLSLLTACGGGNSKTPPANTTGGAATDTPAAAGLPSSAGNPNTPDGVLSLAVTSGESAGFIGSSKDGGFVVSLPSGAVNADVTLRVQSVAAAIDGIVIPGFTVTDANNPGGHVALSGAAAVTFFSENELPGDVTIVRYLDDMRGYETVPTQVITTDRGTLLTAEVNGFSGYGVGKAGCVSSGSPTGIDSLVWRLEAKMTGVRVSEGDGNANLTFFMRADSARGPVTNNNLAIPRTYTGVFDMDMLTMFEKQWVWDGTDMPLGFLFHMIDNNLKITMLPKLKKASEAAWNKYYSDLMDWGMLDYIIQMKAEKGELAPLIPSKPSPQPPAGVFDGYIGWGTAHLLVDELVMQGEGEPVNVPLVIRVKGANATVSFVMPGLGPVELTGTFMGLGVTDAAAPPELEDPMTLVTTYSATAPDNLPPPFTGNPVAELQESREAGNTKITLPGGGWIRLLNPSGKDDDDALAAFLKLWNDYINYKPDQN